MSDHAEPSASPTQSSEENALFAQPDAYVLAYGYGHPAHRPDPCATYVFHPGPPRTLPLNPRRRWRLPG